MFYELNSSWCTSLTLCSFVLQQVLWDVCTAGCSLKNSSSLFRLDFHAVTLDENFSASRDFFQQGASQPSGFTTACPQQGKPPHCFALQWTVASLIPAWSSLNISICLLLCVWITGHDTSAYCWATATLNTSFELHRPSSPCLCVIMTNSAEFRSYPAAPERDTILTLCAVITCKHKVNSFSKIWH